jgi:hypothetical protein
MNIISFLSIMSFNKKVTRELAELQVKFDFNMEKIRRMGVDAWKLDHEQNESIRATLFDLETARLETHATLQELEERRVFMVESCTREANFRALIMEKYAQEFDD